MLLLLFGFEIPGFSWELDQKRCRAVYADGRKEFMLAENKMRTRESIRQGDQNVQKSIELTRRRNSACINGTLLVYMVNRKAGSVTWMNIMSQLAKNGYHHSECTLGKMKKQIRTIYFTFVRHPYGRLVSGYEEITKRHPSLCRKQTHCQPFMFHSEPYVRRQDTEQDKTQSQKNLTQRLFNHFENFVFAYLRDIDFMFIKDDGLAYHIFSQANCLANYWHLAHFVGHLESMEHDIRNLFGLATANPDIIFDKIPALKATVKRDVLPGRYAMTAHDQKILMNASYLSHDAINLISQYYRQDFLCFNYSFADPAHVEDLPWHKKLQLSHSHNNTEQQEEHDVEIYIPPSHLIRRRRVGRLQQRTLHQHHAL